MYADIHPDPLTGLIRPPHPTTIRLVLAAVDDDALDKAIGRFLDERGSPPTNRRVIAIGRETVRGSRTKDQPAIPLIAAMTHEGDVLAQMQVDGKSRVAGGNFAPRLSRSEVGRRRGARGSGPFPTAPSRTVRASFPAYRSPVIISE
ncbi:transposase family protein [Streptomyces cadmiisoli]|uniref:transposase family protein n=1 Tax=Streptomyces cadmiisoli TaxID=2184053 RepID=UPI0013A6F5CF|nr:transposase family protein [Streptomyces cadmiisoli]